MVLWYELEPGKTYLEIYFFFSMLINDEQCKKLCSLSSAGGEQQTQFHLRLAKKEKLIFAFEAETLIMK